MTHFFHGRRKPKSLPADKSGTAKSRAWIEERGRDFHPAFAVESEFNEQQEKYIPAELATIRDLETLLLHHDAIAPPEEPRFYDYTWQMVLDTLDEAKDVASSRKDYSSAAIQGLGMLSPLKDVIPDEYGLSIVKGVLGLVFETAKRGVENRAKILQAFETVPETVLTIQTAYNYLNPTADDEELCREFCRTLVRTLPGLLDVLLKRQPWYRKVTESLTLKIRETLTVDQVLSDWNRYLATIKERLERMKVKITAATAYHSSESHRLGLEANTNIQTLHTELQGARSDIKDLVTEVKKQVGAEYREVFAFHKEQSGAKAMTELLHEFKALCKESREQYEVQQGQIFLLQRAYSDLAHENEALQSTISLSSTNSRDSASTTVTPIELLGILGVSPHTAAQDLEIVLQEGSKFRSSYLGRVRWLARTDEFTEWLRSPQSSLLLVDARLDTSPAIMVTPMSIFVSTLIYSLISSPDCLPLFFFASLHDEDGDRELSGPTGMMRSLITQLLFSDKLATPSLQFLGRGFLNACESNNIKALCELFRRLILQIPPNVQVICLLDGTAAYETGSLTGEEIDYVAALFQRLVEDSVETDSMRLKVLFTFANQSLQISDRVDMYPDVWRYASLAAGHVDPLSRLDFAQEWME
ncbi:hypothetical protein CBS147343_6910 [Aspergillus niger]|uniref:Nephrocystin 3-like N-terminal domain-containing protein n=1 Tax=Aspergillus niger TaxID=5061 RepID=A0A9W6ABU5_ASPNG|nr:hypothetical protein CBS133816_8255 [Aspergillus niger]KAI2851525.1 hypothetical protein CBS12448_8460 [Aspergillus niger]KAI2925136.1 hypothetical protein CBS147371_694 [Aspergillus niger]KAI2930867.1 hypothetical protein CBS147321_10412 [Aspergillus niger]KAI2957010.1 hypothetical protein CBS147324_10814 [Aspergillus niger]